MNRRGVIVVIVIGIVLFGAGYASRMFTTTQNDLTSTNVPGSKKYPLLAKRLFVENPNDNIVNFAPLRQQLKSYIHDNNLNGSLYFEYLPTGTSIRVDGDEMRVAASLIKLPAAMDLYKAAELGKINLDKKVSLQESWLDSGYGTLYQKGAGYELTLRDATKIMLSQSDNTALNTIAYSVGNSLSTNERAINALDTDISQNPDLTVSIGARSYTSFLKCLYFACYLNFSDSQELLTYLSKSDFNNRLVAGVADKTIKIAHKIGVANTTTQSDCGIVYVPNRNYALCVMINDEDNDQTNAYIAHLSKLTYDYVKAAK